jgi:hypothetical protein
MAMNFATRTTGRRRTVSYRVLERPGIALSARWSRRRLDAATA